MAVLIELADAVVAALNAGGFSMPFTAVRAYQPVYELPDMHTLRVTVVPRGVEMEVTSRSLLQHDYQVDVAVQRRFAAAEAAELDPLMALVEEVIDYFRMRRIALDNANAICVRVANEPVFALEHIEQLRQFTSVITLTFRVLR